MRNIWILFATIIIFGCNDDNNQVNETISGIPHSADGTCTVNSGILTCSGTITELSEMDQIEGLSEVRFTNVSLTQQELNSMPVLSGVKTFEIQGKDSEITALDLSKLPVIQTLILEDNLKLTTISQLNQASTIEELVLINNQNLSSLDLTALSNLKHLTYSQFRIARTLQSAQSLANSVISLDQLPNPDRLKELYLNGSGTSITSSSQIIRFSNLVELGLNNDIIKSNDILANEIINHFKDQLVVLELYSNDLSLTIDAQQLTKLKKINLYNNPKLSVSNVGGFPEDLTFLGLSNTNTNITHSENITRLTQLTYLDLDSINTEANIIESIVSHGFEHLESLDISGNSLTSLDLSKTPNLLFLDIYNNPALALDLTTLPKSIKDLYLGNTAVTNLAPLAQIESLRSLELSGLTNIDPQLEDILNQHRSSLSFLNLSFSDVTVINVSNMPELTTLYASMTDNLTSVEVSNLPSLTDLEINGGQSLTSVTLLNLEKLEFLSISTNHILNELSITGLNNLEHIGMNANLALNSTVLSDLPKLESITAINNPLLNLVTLRNLPNLEYVWMSGNASLSTFDNDQLPKLKILDLSDTSMQTITSFDMPELYSLYISGSSLTTLNLNDHPKLDSVDLSFNTNLVNLSITNTPSLTWVALTQNTSQQTVVLDSDTTTGVDLNGAIQLLSQINQLQADYPSATFVY